jgi:hypothetical protein
MFLTVVLAASHANGDQPPAPMNNVDYLIANPAIAGDTKRSHRGEYFEFYGPPRTSHYSEVVWDNQVTPLPADIVKRFDDKVMAIIGLEVDIIRKSADGSDSSVSCFEQ